MLFSSRGISLIQISQLFSPPSYLKVQGSLKMPAEEARDWHLLLSLRPAFTPEFRAPLVGLSTSLGPSVLGVAEVTEYGPQIPWSWPNLQGSGVTQQIVL